MKKSRLLGAVFTCVCLLISLSAGATTVVDTGPAAPGVIAGFSFSEGKWLSAQFTTTSDYTIGSIEGWISLSEADTFGTVAIYTNSASNEPDTELFSATFEGTGRAADWLGTSGMSWNLLAGTYWVSYLVRNGQTIDASMPTPSADPLGLEAWSLNQGATWSVSDSPDIGVRIQAIPLPSGSSAAAS